MSWKCPLCDVIQFCRKITSSFTKQANTAITQLEKSGAMKQFEKKTGEHERDIQMKSMQYLETSSTQMNGCIVANPKWAIKSNSEKHVIQVIINESKIDQINPWVSHQLFNPLLMQPNLTWGMIGMFLTGFKDPGLFIKASRVFSRLRESRCRLAFAFYKMPESGIFAALLDFPTFDLGLMVSKGPFVVETQWNPSYSEDIEIVDALVQLDSISIHFLTDNLQASYSRAININHQCKQKIIDLWEEAKSYNNQIHPSKFNYQAALRRYNNENPIDVSPILPNDN